MDSCLGEWAVLGSCIENVAFRREVSLVSEHVCKDFLFAFPPLNSKK